MTAAMLADGNPEGLHRLLKDHGGRVLRLLKSQFHRMLDTHDIDDALAQACQRLLRSRTRPGAKVIEHPDAYLLTIARNCALRIASAKHHPRQSNGSDPDLRTGRDEGDLGYRLLHQDVEACLQRLPERQHYVMAADLRHGGSVPAQQLADELGTTPAAIYTLRADARRTLKQELQRIGHDLFRFDLSPEVRP